MKRIIETHIENIKIGNSVLSPDGIERTVSRGDLKRDNFARKISRKESIMNRLNIDEPLTPIRQRMKARRLKKGAYVLLIGFLGAGVWLMSWLAVRAF